MGDEEIMTRIFKPGILLLSVITATLSPVAANVLTAELYYDEYDPEYAFTITVKGIDPPLAENQVNADVVRLIDATTNTVVAIDSLQGGVSDGNGLYPVVHFYGKFDPTAHYKVIIVYDKEKQVECAVESNVASTNWVTERDLNRKFDVKLDLLIPERMEAFDLGYDVKFLPSTTFPRPSFPLRFTTSGLIKLGSMPTETQNRFTGSVNLKYVRDWQMSVPIRPEGGVKTEQTLKYYYGFGVDVTDVEADQQWKVVDYMVKARSFAYLPFNVITIGYYEAFQDWGIVKGDRPTPAPYISAAYSRTVKRTARETAAVSEPKNRIDLEGKWILPFSDRVDIQLKYDGLCRLGKLGVDQKRYEGFFDARTVLNVKQDASARFLAGYQEGKLPPLNEFSKTVFAGFAASVF